MMDNKNFLIAIALSIAVLVGWQYFFAGPEIERARQQQQIAEQQKAADQVTQPDTSGSGSAQPAGTSAAPTAAGGGGGATTLSREQALAESPRVPISTPSVSGSINLRGGRIDDLRLNDFHETVDPTSPTIILLSPADAPDGYFAEFGWIGATDAGPMPGPDTVWTAPAGAELSVDKPVTLTYDNGKGLTFSRKIAVDEHYMFTVTRLGGQRHRRAGRSDALRAGDADRRAEDDGLLHPSRGADRRLR